MIKDIMFFIYKEMSEQKKTIIKLIPMSILILVPLVLVATNKGSFGNSLVSKKTIITMFPNLLGGGICYELVRNNILFERKSKMLDIIFISEVSKTAIIIGKAVPGVLVGSIISFLGNIILLVNNEFISYFSIVGLIMVPFVLFLLCIINLNISLIIKDEKIASFVSAIVMVIVCMPLAFFNSGINFLLVLTLDILFVVIATQIKWKV